MPTQLPPPLVVRGSPGKGRGVYAAIDVRDGCQVLCDPVALIEVDALRDGSAFNDYPMRWSETHNAIALGLCNLLNHSDEPNCEVIPDRTALVMRCKTLRRIEGGEELTIQYACPVWWAK